MDRILETWQGKTVAFLGDSITEGVGVEPSERYFELLGKRLGFLPHGYGICGFTFAGLEYQIEQMKKELGDNVDGIFILCGTNDFYGGTPMGEWYSYSTETVVSCRNEDGSPRVREERKVRTVNDSPDTYLGAINHTVLSLKRDYPKAQIVLMTPTHRAFATFGPDNIQYSELYSNSIGLFFDEYADKIRTAAKMYSVELIDLCSASGLFPLADGNAAEFFCDTETDRLHPSALGHKRMADVIYAKLSAIPCY